MKKSVQSSVLHEPCGCIARHDPIRLPAQIRQRDHPVITSVKKGKNSRKKCFSLFPAKNIHRRTRAFQTARYRRMHARRSDKIDTFTANSSKSLQASPLQPLPTSNPAFREPVGLNRFKVFVAQYSNFMKLKLPQ
jgi:hypothetical protein